MRVLALNAGSSSLKAALYEVSDAAELARPAPPLWTGATDGTSPPNAATVNALLARLTAELGLDDLCSIGTVGHRIVHGGREFVTPTLVDDSVVETIRGLSDLAPSHNPANALGLEIARAALPDARHVAVFDTGFHATLPPAAFTLSGPRSWGEAGIRRYGFHGISHDYVSRRAAALLKRPIGDLRIVTCHLGNGCSLAAVHRGRSVDTTMGFTPLDGLVMGSRSGSVDPGVLLYLLRAGTSVDELDVLLNRQSGLLGISGVSSDMRALRLAIASGDADARLAVDVFGHRLRGQIATMAASMGGVDVLVFTAGIGEHDAATRAETVNGLGFLGVAIDDSLNKAAIDDVDVSTTTASVRTLVVRTEENWAIACQAAALLP